MAENNKEGVVKSNIILYFNYMYNVNLSIFVLNHRRKDTNYVV